MKTTTKRNPVRMAAGLIAVFFMVYYLTPKATVNFVSAIIATIITVCIAMIICVPSTSENQDISARLKAMPKTPSADVTAQRKRVENDILICIADRGMSFDWLGTISVTEILLWKTGKSREPLEGHLEYNDDYTRVERVVYQEDGLLKKAENIPFLAGKFQSRDSESNASGQNELNITEPATDDEIGRSDEISTPPPVTTKTREKESETVKGADINNNTGIPDNVLKTSASLIWDDINGQISELLSVAHEDGKESLSFAWPEGIQSAYEANSLVEIMQEALDLRVETKEENQIITVFLPVETPQLSEEDTTVTNVVSNNENETEIVDFTEQEGYAAMAEIPDSFDDDVPPEDDDD